MNKKAIESIILDSAGFLVLIILLVIFWVLMFSTGKIVEQKSIAAESSIVNSGELLLLNYLRSDVKVDLDGDGTLEDINMVDLIGLSYDSGKYKDKLEDATKKILEIARPYKSAGWNIEIKREDNSFISEVKTMEIIGKYDKFNSNIKIPTYNDKIVSIRLYLETDCDTCLIDMENDFQ